MSLVTLSLLLSAFSGFFSGVAFGGAFAGAGVVAFAGVITGAVVVVGVVVFSIVGFGFIPFAVAFATAFTLLSAYIASRASRGDEKFALIRTISVAFGAIGGTSFCGADLTDANFTKAILESTNFNHTKQKQTTLNHVCWAEAKKLDRARLGASHS